MPGPRAVQNLQYPTPGTDMAGKCPAVACGGGGEGGWAQVELTDALSPSFVKLEIKWPISETHDFVNL